MPHRSYRYKIGELKARVGILNGVIVDPQTKDALLRLPEEWLGNMERFAEPTLESILPMIEQTVKHAETLVAMYGPGVCIVRGLGAKAGRASGN